MVKIGSEHRKLPNRTICQCPSWQPGERHSCARSPPRLSMRARPAHITPKRRRRKGDAYSVRVLDASILMPAFTV
ncbi:hypothetical protein OH77DRAFT_724009 [Trametes cingulata]|nr:hypothetical protein OH77DRAFT_724009 [Trametes cingulata]